ncbi:chymotrypsin-1-like [Epargyreus clarus]|uniref:chymotrypsin-1-like n=1 Tax=Epargyreus clarus TaxID=520877 RepID=UPI003C2FED07
MEIEALIHIRSSLRIVGGYEAPPEFGLFHVSLQNLTGHHVCGGAVISPGDLVTAAHCVLGAEPQYIKVIVGTTNLDQGGHQYDVQSILIHSEYNISVRQNDIAIVRIKGMFDLRSVRILHLGTKKLQEGDPVVLTGFGAQEPNGESSRRMHILNLTVFDQDICNFAMRYSRQVTDRMFCTFTRVGQGTCHGDSGGPLTWKNELVGIVSWGIPCAIGFPDVHTRISSYIPWIRYAIRNM